MLLTAVYGVHALEKTRQDFYSITNDHYVLRNIPSI